MKISSVQTSYHAPVKTAKNATNVIKNTVNHSKTGHKVKAKAVLPAIVLSLTALFASTCSNTRGGNFVYNEETEKIEKFEDTKKLDINDMDYCSKNQYRNCYDKNFFKNVDVDKWINDNKEQLTGSCLFDTDKKLLSKLIGVFSKTDNCEFVPTHAASIYEDENGQMKIMQIKPPKVVIEDLADYIKNSDKNFMIFVRDFEINKERFCENVKKIEGKPYGFISAGQAVSSLVNIDGGLHCSEGYVRDIQNEGMFKNIDANKITPHTLLHLLTNREQSTTF